MSSTHIKLEGQWVGYGTETELDANNTIQKTDLKLIKNIEKVSKNTYKVTETYYYMNETINYGPVNYIISTGCKDEKFICSDSLGMGIDFYNVNGKYMIYRYNINGIPISQSQPYSSLDGNFKLKKIH